MEAYLAPPPEQGAVQYLDVKELNDLAHQYRARIRDLIVGYRTAQAASAGQGEMYRRVYVSYEAIYLRRQIADLWKVYRIVMADCVEITETYYQQLSNQKYTSASRPTGKENRAAA
jgi:hypothetical protein